MFIGDEQHRLNHFNEVVRRARLLLDGGLDKIQVSDDSTTDVDGYSFMHEGELYEWSHKELISQLKENAINSVEEWDPYEMFDCLIHHLEAEDDVYHFRDLFYLIENHPLLVIKHLLALTQWDTLKGTCPLCEEWQ